MRTSGSARKSSGKSKSAPKRAARAAPAPNEAAATWLDPEKLKPWPGNPRDTAGAVARVAESIKRFGFAAPIVARADGFEIIAGHTRTRAAIALGIKLVPVRLLDIGEREAHVLALRDNRDVEQTRWSDTLADVLRELPADDALFAGWSQRELDRLTRELDDATPPAEFVAFEAGQKPTVDCPKCGYKVALPDD